MDTQPSQNCSELFSVAICHSGVSLYFWGVLTTPLMLNNKDPAYSSF